MIARMVAALVFGAALALSANAADKVLRLAPMDEGPRDASFLKFRNDFKAIGLVMYASNPEVTILCCSSGITEADTASTGTASSSGSSRIRRSAVMPSMSGS